MSTNRLMSVFICALVTIHIASAANKVAVFTGGSDNPDPYPGANQFYVTPDGIILMFPNPDEFGAMAPARSSSGHAPLASTPAKDASAIVVYTIEDPGPREFIRIPSDALEVSDSFVASDGGSSVWVVWCEDRRAIKMAHVLDGALVEVSTVSGQDEVASKPSVARGGVVAYQRLAGTQVEVVFAERAGAGWTREVVAAVPTSSSGPGADAHVLVHAMVGTAWVDWRYSDGMMGYVFRDPSSREWSESSLVPYSWAATGDSEYTAREMARVVIRRLVLGERPRSQN